MRVIGGYEFSLSRYPGFRPQDSALCFLALSPNADIETPIVFGFQQGGRFHQLMPFIDYDNAPKATFHEQLTSIEDAPDKIHFLKNRIVLPIIQVKYGSEAWGSDPFWIYEYYQDAAQFLENENGYLIRNIRDNARIASEATGFFSKLVPLLDR